MNFKIKKRKISDTEPVFLIAELSANHCGKFDIAVQLIEKAAQCGVDAVKIQTYTADTITLDCDNEYFQIKQG
ncbi:MAG: N-acetylneuraminate synthase family protein, partial [Spirochaetes bacterium]|nr:N-acetylneuraminate synthase family protein [Spirochaetota bacterium]